MSKTYWYYDPIIDDYDNFNTEEERDKAVKSLLKHDLMFDDMSWDEDAINEVKIGESNITHKIERFIVCDRPDEDEIDDDGYDKHDMYWGDDRDHQYEFKIIKKGDGDNE